MSDLKEGLTINSTADVTAEDIGILGNAVLSGHLSERVAGAINKAIDYYNRSEMSKVVDVPVGMEMGSHGNPWLLNNIPYLKSLMDYYSGKFSPGDAIVFDALLEARIRFLKNGPEGEE